MSAASIARCKARFEEIASSAAEFRRRKPTAFASNTPIVERSSLGGVFAHHGENGDVILIAPPFEVSDAEIGEIAGIMDRTLTELNL
jgi:4-aminobutyrate aminotransferase-like enzyme